MIKTSLIETKMLDETQKLKMKILKLDEGKVENVCLFHPTWKIFDFKVSWNLLG